MADPIRPAVADWIDADKFPALSSATPQISRSASCDGGFCGNNNIDADNFRFSSSTIPRRSRSASCGGRFCGNNVDAEKAPFFFSTAPRRSRSASCGASCNGSFSRNIVAENFISSSSTKPRSASGDDHLCSYDVDVNISDTTTTERSFEAPQRNRSPSPLPSGWEHMHLTVEEPGDNNGIAPASPTTEPSLEAPQHNSSTSPLPSDLDHMHLTVEEPGGAKETALGSPLAIVGLPHTSDNTTATPSHEMPRQNRSPSPLPFDMDHMHLTVEEAGDNKETEPGSPLTVISSPGGSLVDLTSPVRETVPKPAVFIDLTQDEELARRISDEWNSPSDVERERKAQEMRDAELARKLAQEWAAEVVVPILPPLAPSAPLSLAAPLTASSASAPSIPHTFIAVSVGQELARKRKQEEEDERLAKRLQAELARFSKPTLSSHVSPSAASSSQAPSFSIKKEPSKPHTYNIVSKGKEVEGQKTPSVPYTYNAFSKGLELERKRKQEDEDERLAKQLQAELAKFLKPTLPSHVAQPAASSSASSSPQYKPPLSALQQLNPFSLSSPHKQQKLDSKQQKLDSKTVKVEGSPGFLQQSPIFSAKHPNPFMTPLKTESTAFGASSGMNSKQSSSTYRPVRADVSMSSTGSSSTPVFIPDDRKPTGPRPLPASWLHDAFVQSTALVNKSLLPASPFRSNASGSNSGKSGNGKIPSTQDSKSDNVTGHFAPRFGELPFPGNDLDGEMNPVIGAEGIQPYEYHYTRRLTPQQQEEELKAMFEAIEAVEAPPPPEQRMETPQGLTIQLMEHQKIGVEWLTHREEKGKGGLLADDMGLGKTVQSIALIVARPPPPADPDTDLINQKRITLIVAPVSLVHQWYHEIMRKTTPGKFKVIIYHGQNRERNSARLATYDIIITTYSIVGMEHPAREKKGKDRGREAEQRPFGPLFDLSYYRIILDEAQIIKNKTTQAAIACCALKAEFRWCLSGTPIQNSLDELFSLIRFLRIPPYCDYTKFKNDIINVVKSNNHKKGYHRLQVLMKAMCLRRTKDAMIDGRKVLELPPRNVATVTAQFTPDEREFYSALEQKARIRFSKFLLAGTVMKNYSSILVLLLRLRQACGHPHLISHDFVVDTQPADELLDPPVGLEKVKDREEELVASLSDDVVRRLKEQDAEGDLERECGICMDGGDSPMLIPGCGHGPFCMECLSVYAGGNEDEGGKPCPSCRGPLPIDRLVPLNAFLRIHKPPRAAIEGKGKAPATAEDEAAAAAEEIEGELASASQAQPVTHDSWMSSTKIDRMMDLLRETRKNHPGEKTVVFSQFTKLLDLIEHPLREENFKYVRYDGSMHVRDRADAVSKLEDESEGVEVALISLKCGSLGLNLTCANRVILMDLWWNQALENQAIDRCHRIGQQKSVEVSRIVIPDTVEDRILKLQDEKRNIIEGALGEGKAERVGRLGLEDLRFLFGAPAPALPPPPALAPPPVLA